MLKNIKSLYFTQIIYTYVNDAQKLKIIKYNKNLQKIIDINIINYIHFRGRYIIYESNGIGKEYDGQYDALLFQGEYKNRKRNGKGKEYWAIDRLEFEGEYKNGKRNGKGKEYYWNGKLIFEGEYLNGKKNGKGKEYYLDGKLKFDGEYLNDRQKIGNYYDSDGKIFFKLKNNELIKEYYFDGRN